MLKNILSGVGVVLLVFFVLALFSPSTDTTPEPIVVEVPQKDTDSLGSLKSFFMDGCSPNGELVDFCSCGFEYLDKTHTNEELMDLFLSTEEEMQPTMDEAAIACSKYLE